MANGRHIENCYWRYFFCFPTTFWASTSDAFVANDNSICRLFSKQAEINLKKLFSNYDIVSSISELKIIVENLHFACH